MQLYNTLTRQKERFVPQNPDRVTMYVCGPTVYSYAHIGNARPAVVFDVLARLLRRQFPEVVYARNITDIDDKINKAAAEQGVEISVIAQRYTEAYYADLAALGVAEVDLAPKVTDNVDAIVEMIGNLIERGHAYAAEGHVLFDVQSYEGYGELSKRDVRELIAGARVEVAPYKRYAGDFVLWKPSADDQPGWDSPWGRGRPGWHIECSAMAARWLGETIDIHGGGNDLVFPHHENERAQSTCAHGGATFARYWLHNGFLNMNQEKMSKSLGNVLLVKDLIDQAPGEAVRLALLNAQYRQPLDWSDDTLVQARRQLDRLYGALRDLAAVPAADGVQAPAELIEALEDDLNTPAALAVLFDRAKAANKAQSDEERARIKAELLDGGLVLGLLQQAPEDWFAAGSSDDGMDAAAIEALIEERNAARKNRDFATADRVRDELAAQGVLIEDSAEGTRWRRA